MLVNLSRSLLLVCSSLVLGCAGLGDNYDTPASSDQIPFTIEPVTAALVSELKLAPPAVSMPPDGSIAANDYAYRIGPTDTLSIFVNQSLFGDRVGVSVDRQAESLYAVNEEGRIFLPLHGALKVSGLTIGEAYAEIENVLGAFINRPQINVRVADYRSQRIAIAGAVAKPGYLPITDRATTITEAVIASGVTDYGDLHKVTLKRKGSEYVLDVSALMQSPEFGKNWVLQDGDVIYIPKNENRVYVLGEAPNRTQLIDPYSTTLAEVLLGVQASGLSPNYLQDGATRAGNIFVIRGGLISARVFHFNGSSPESFILADNFPLSSGDIVYVSSRPITRFNRFIAQLLPVLNSVLGPALIINTLQNQ